MKLSEKPNLNYFGSKTYYSREKNIKSIEEKLKQTSSPIVDGYTNYINHINKKKMNNAHCR